MAHPPLLFILILHFFLIGIGFHDLFVLSTIARHNIAIRINEEGIKTHIARKQTLLTIDVVDQAVVKVSTEPLLRAIAAEQFIDQILEILSNHRTVVDDVLTVSWFLSQLHPSCISRR